MISSVVFSSTITYTSDAVFAGVAGQHPETV